MSTKRYCDACGKENPDNTFSYLCHLDNLTSNAHSYVDSEDNCISGRLITVDLCNKCYNAVVYPSVQKFKEIKNEH